MELFIFFYVFGCFAVAFVFGSAREIGFLLSFGVCLVLTPLFGFILTLLSRSKAKIKHEKDMLDYQRQTLEYMKQQSK